ncbi:MAG: response regulator, partial [Ruminococcus sp.]|nr:response regulator [Ruminococcus sp.]
MIKVIIADDIQILRTGIKAVLSQDSEIEVVGEAGNGREVYEMCVRMKPDVVLMDMRMPDFDGSYGTRKIKDNLKNIKVLVLTTFDDKETVDRAVASGADGYTVKETEKDKTGTVITLYLKESTEDENYDEFLEEYRISGLVKKYSDYIRYPIRML